jgi:hypothetical protein
LHSRLRACGLLALNVSAGTARLMDPELRVAAVEIAHFAGVRRTDGEPRWAAAYSGEVDEIGQGRFQRTGGIIARRVNRSGTSSPRNFQEADDTWLLASSLVSVSQAPNEITQMFDHLAPLIAAGAISAPVSASYGFDQVREAITKAALSGGKVLFTPKT